jgi:hypothetical protein
MTTEQTSHHTLDHLRYLSSELISFGHGAHGIAADVEQLIRERDRARAERDELRECERILREALKDAASHRDELRADRDRAQAATATSVPRVITPDELREGQTVAVVGEDGVYQGGGLYAGLSSRLLGGLRMEVTSGRTGSDSWVHKDSDTIVLLSDAPAGPEPEPWEPETGDVGIVTHFDGGELDEPVAAGFVNACWYRLDRRNWPDETLMARPHEVVVRRAKVVPDDE